MGNLAGEAENGRLRLGFDRRLRLGFRGAKVIADAGLPAARELDGVLGLTGMAGVMIEDARTGRNLRHGLTGPLQQPVYARPAGYEDVNDRERLFRDPAMRAAVGRKALDRGAASPRARSCFETEALATEETFRRPHPSTTPGWERRCARPRARRSSWTWAPRGPRCAAAGRDRPGTGISTVPAIIPPRPRPLRRSRRGNLEARRVHSPPAGRRCRDATR